MSKVVKFAGASPPAKPAAGVMVTAPSNVAEFREVMRAIDAVERVSTKINGLWNRMQYTTVAGKELLLLPGSTQKALDEIAELEFPWERTAKSRALIKAYYDRHYTDWIGDNGERNEALILAQVAGEIAILIDRYAFPLPNPDVFVKMLVAEVMATEPEPFVVRMACDNVARSSRKTPSCAEILEACEAAKARWGVIAEYVWTYGDRSPIELMRADHEEAAAYWEEMCRQHEAERARLAEEARIAKEEKLAADERLKANEVRKIDWALSPAAREAPNPEVHYQNLRIGMEVRVFPRSGPDQYDGLHAVVDMLPPGHASNLMRIGLYLDDGSQAEVALARVIQWHAEPGWGQIEEYSLVQSRCR